MKLKSYFRLFILLIITTVLQGIYPAFSISGTLITPDLFLLFLTYIALKHGRFSSVTFGFSLGLIQDFTTQIELLGTFSFVKSIAGYVLGTIYNYERIWSKQIRWLIIVSAYFMHFSILYFVKLNGSSVTVFQGVLLVSIHSTINLILLYLLNKILFDSKLV